MCLISKIVFLTFSAVLLQSCTYAAKQSITPVPVEDHSVEINQGDTAHLPPMQGPDKRSGEMLRQPKQATGQEYTGKHPVVVALLEKADLKIKSGDNAGAAATLERVLRLEPKNAMLWYRLGLLRLQQQNWQQAINLAKKSNTLAAGDHRLQSANWRLIARAYSRAGNNQGAKSAANRANALDKLEQSGK